jgi:hypothetical protein
MMNISAIDDHCQGPNALGRILRRGLAAALLGAGLLGPTPSAAQIPDHPPGSICLTPYMWCWMPRPGPLNYPCACYTPGGPVGGRLV